MTIMGHSFEFTIRPVPPYNFELTVRKPAGWALFTPFELYADGTLWTAANMGGTLVGIRLVSKGTWEKPEVIVVVFTEKEQNQESQEIIEQLINRALGSGTELNEFYDMAVNDSILKHTIEELYGMHDTFHVNIFPDAILAILLQMAPLKRSNEMMECFIRKYGEIAEFDGKKVFSWPTPHKISTVQEDELSTKCKVGYRAKFIVKLAKKLADGEFPSMEKLAEMKPDEAKKTLQELPGIGDYSADIINPHGGFPIDAWSAEVFSKLFFDNKPENNREAVDRVKKEGLKRWGKWSWMAFFYIVQDLQGLSRKLGKDLRLT